MGEVVVLGKLSGSHSQPLYGQRVLPSPTSAYHFQRSHKGLPLLGRMPECSSMAFQQKHSSPHPAIFTLCARPHG